MCIWPKLCHFFVSDSEVKKKSDKETSLGFASYCIHGQAPAHIKVKQQINAIKDVEGMKLIHNIGSYIN